MNNFLIESLMAEKGTISRPVVGRPGKRKSCFIDHNDYVRFSDPGTTYDKLAKFRPSTIGGREEK